MWVKNIGDYTPLPSLGPAELTSIHFTIQEVYSKLSRQCQFVLLPSSASTSTLAEVSFNLHFSHKGSVDHFYDFWIQKSHHFYDLWIQKSLGPFSQLLDPETAVFLRFLDPEIAPFLQYLDPEIFWSIFTISGSINCSISAVYGSRNSTISATSGLSMSFISKKTLQ